MRLILPLFYLFLLFFSCFSGSSGSAIFLLLIWSCALACVFFFSYSSGVVERARVRQAFGTQVVRWVGIMCFTFGSRHMSTRARPVGFCFYHHRRRRQVSGWGPLPSLLQSPFFSHFRSFRFFWINIARAFGRKSQDAVRFVVNQG